MPNSLTNIQQIAYDAKVKQSYQSRGKLFTKAVYAKQTNHNYQEQFRKIGTVTAQQSSFGQNITAQDPNFAQVACSLSKWRAGEVIDKTQERTNNVDDERAMLETIAYALARRADQLIIDVMDAATVPAANDIANGGTNLTYAKLQSIIAVFASLGVPPSERFMSIGGSQESALLGINQFTDNDFTNKGRMVINNGSVDGSHNLGMNFIVIPDMAEGGLPKTGNIRTCFAWHRWSVGMAWNENIHMRKDYLPESDQDLLQGNMYAGACAIDGNGIIKIDCDETA